MKIISLIRKSIGQLFIDKCFPIWQKLGFFIIRNHFYEPVFDIRILNDEFFSSTSDMIGIDMQENEQIKLLSKFVKYKDEYEKFSRKMTEVSNEYYVYNGVFESVDGEVYYCMIRHFKPKIIIEVGSGYSTYLSAQAILKNKEETGKQAKLITIEPFPNKTLRDGFQGLSELIITNVQEIDVSHFTILDNNDILFIDSSHVLNMGNDVHFLYLEVLPRLKSGVIVHSHDIFLPLPYPRNVLKNQHRFWNEQYLLQAFLAFNDAFEVIFGNHFMHLRHPEKLKDAFESYELRKVKPGSFYIKKK